MHCGPHTLWLPARRVSSFGETSARLIISLVRSLYSTSDLVVTLPPVRAYRKPLIKHTWQTQCLRRGQAATQGIR